MVKTQYKRMRPGYYVFKCGRVEIEKIGLEPDFGGPGWVLTIDRNMHDVLDSYRWAKTVAEKVMDENDAVAHE